jgi:replicative DNA helicase
MKMKPAIEMIFGAILQFKQEDAIEIFNRIDTRFLKTSFHKNVHRFIGELIREKKSVDLLTLSLKFKENGLLKNGVAGDISRLTSEMIPSSVNSLFAYCEDEVVFEEAMKIRNQIDNELEQQSLTFDKFKTIINEGAKIEFKKEKQQTNVDVIFDVVIDHNNAKEGVIAGTDIGYFQLKNSVILEPVDMMVIGARTGMGKSAFGVSTMCRLMKQGKKVVFFALEMSKKQVVRRMIANLSGIDSNRIKFGECTSKEVDLIFSIQSQDFWNNVFIFEGTHSMKDISVKMHQLKRQHNIDIFIVDYLQKIQPKKNGSRYEQVTDISNELKSLIQNIQIPCVAFAQLSRDSSKTGKRPTLPDLKESGEIEQDASVVAFLHRPEYYGEETTINGTSAIGVCEFLVAKNREGEVGVFEMSVDLKTSRFE